MKRKASKSKIEGEDVLLCPLIPGESPPKLTNEMPSVAQYGDSVGSGVASNAHQQLQGSCHCTYYSLP